MPARPAETDAGRTARLQAVLDEAVDEHGLVGLQACVRTPEGAWCGTGGTADPGRRDPLLGDHLFRIGSITKIFVAALVLGMADDGLLDVEDPLSKYIPEFPGAAGITLEQLLANTSGIFSFHESYRFLGRVMLASFFHCRPVSPLDAIEAAVARAPDFEAGTEYHYSNTGWVILGLIAERAAGRPVAELLRERLFEPLGLEETLFSTGDDLPERLVNGVDRGLVPVGTRKIDARNTYWDIVSFTSGAMITNAEDLSRFMDALFHGRVLAPESLARMHDFRDIVESDRDGPDPYWNGYGLGLCRFVIDGDELWGHAGAFFGYCSITAYSEETDSTAVLLSNVSDYGKYRYRILHDLLTVGAP